MNMIFVRALKFEENWRHALTYVAFLTRFYLLVIFTISNSNYSLLTVKLEDSTMRDLKVLKGKGYLGALHGH
jgi:hypothetical protein